MPSRSIVRRAARAVGITRWPLSRSSSTRVWVWIASISGTTRCGFSLRDQVAQRRRIEHVQRVAAMRDLHRRRVVVAVGGDHLDAEALQLDRHFLAQLARAEQQHAGGARGQRRAEGDGDRSAHVGSRRSVKPHCSGEGSSWRAFLSLLRPPVAQIPPRMPSLLILLAALFAADASASRWSRAEYAGAVHRSGPGRSQRPGRVARPSGHVLGAQRRRQRQQAGRHQAATGATSPRWRSMAPKTPTGKTSTASTWTASTTCWSPIPATTAACARRLPCTSSRNRSELRDGDTLRPAWSIAFRWPDGARDCEAIAVDAAAGGSAADLEEARAAGTVPPAPASGRRRARPRSWSARWAALPSPARAR